MRQNNRTIRSRRKGYTLGLQIARVFLLAMTAYGAEPFQCCFIRIFRMTTMSSGNYGFKAKPKDSIASYNAE